MKQLVPILVLIFLFLSCERENYEHEVAIIGGSGSGTYTLGATVEIEADPAPDGMVFDRWRGDTALLGEPTARVTRFEMPLRDVNLQSTYSDLPLFYLEVINGTGSGAYQLGTEVLVSANPAPGFHEFTGWQGDIGILKSDVDSTEAIAIMPAEDARLEAVFEEIILSFSQDVWPVFKQHCATQCHGKNSNTEEPLTNYEEIIDYLNDVEEFLITGYMPPTPTMTQEEIDLILLWIDQGAPNN